MHISQVGERRTSTPVSTNNSDSSLVAAMCAKRAETGRLRTVPLCRSRPWHSLANAGFKSKAAIKKLTLGNRSIRSECLALSVSLTGVRRQPYEFIDRRRANAHKARKRPTRVAKANAERVEIRETYRDTMKRYSKTMALLAE